MNLTFNNLLFSLLSLWAGGATAEAQQMDELKVASTMKELAIIPDILDAPPVELLKMHYDNNVEITEGKIYQPSELKFQPKLEWDSMEMDEVYTILMLSPDAPSRDNPFYRSWLHWLVVNVPGNNTDQGQVISEYFGPIPPKQSGLLRYVALVYKQSTKLEFDEQKLNLYNAGQHSNFDLASFTRKYQMGNPLAGNVFQSQWDDYVPELLKLLYDVSL